MEDSDFTLDNLNKDISQEARDAMIDVILTWARYDSLVSQWTIAAFGMCSDSGTIFLGNMDTRTKLDRLKSLYQHYGLEESVKTLAALQKLHLEYVDVRNSIAHHTCAGCWRTAPQMIVFAPMKTIKGVRDHLALHHIPLKSMHEAADFARHIGNQLLVVTDRFVDRPSEPPLEPLAFLPNPDPIPHGKRQGKRRQRRQEQRG